MTKTVFIAVANHCADVDSSSHVIGVFTSKALAIRAGVKSYQEGGIFSWYIRESELDSGSCTTIEVSDEELDSALKGW